MTAPRRARTDQFEMLRAEMALFQDSVRNARYTSRPARLLLSLGAFFGFPVRLARSAAYRWRSP